MSFQERLSLSLGEVLTEGKTPKPAVEKPDCALSKKQIDEHYDKHYLSYLKGIKEAEQALRDAKFDVDAYRSAVMRYSFNYNGIILHEHYFSCLGNSEMPKDVSKLVKETFDTRKNMEKHLKTALMASRGWVIMSHDLRQNQFLLNIVDDHDIHTMLAHPVLVLDAWEHAYYIDYQADKEKYADAVIGDINWKAVEERMLRIEDGHSISRIPV